MKENKPQIGLSLMLTPDFVNASYPLFEAGEVDCLEWSFDMGWGYEKVPEWAEELLSFYSDHECLLGHGVSYSALSAKWTPRHQSWLNRLKKEVQQRKYTQISEHFGFMNAGIFHQSTPLPVPFTPETLRLGQDHLKRLADIAQVPIGLENLAFAFGTRDVDEQGEFLEALLAPVDGFLVLDLHNLYCQMYNFDRSASDLLARYPLDRVWEIHISGGSWYQALSPREAITVRRDTHDEAVPTAVFKLLEETLPRCPQLKTIIFERIGNTLQTPADIDAYRKDFQQIKDQVNSYA